MTLHIVLAVLGYYIFSASADAMLAPLPGRERTFYGWFYRFAQSLAANTSRLAEQRFGIPEVLPRVSAAADDWERANGRRLILVVMFFVIAFLATWQILHPQTPAQHQPAVCPQEGQ